MGGRVVSFADHTPPYLAPLGVGPSNYLLRIVKSATHAADGKIVT